MRRRRSRPGRVGCRRPALVGDDGARALREHLAAALRDGEFSPHVVDRYCVAGTPEECAARVREYVDAGAEHIVFNLGSQPDGCRADRAARERWRARAAAR